MNRKTLKILFVITVVLLLVPAIMPLTKGSTKQDTIKQAPESSLATLEAAYPKLSAAINITSVRKHMEFFSSLGTRAVGYEGNWKAAQYIHNKFVEYGLTNVSYYPFKVVDAISHGANATLLDTGQVLTLHPLRPNMICLSTTPPEGITGTLIYARSGFLKDFEIGAKEANADVQGSIVLLDWYTGNRWITAAKLGAKAVIFIPPATLSHGTYGAFEEKWLPETPFLFPRFYAEANEANILLKNVGKKVHIVATQRWEEVTSWNVIGFVPGERLDKIILISSYYDSKSVVPTVSPGAEESVGVSVLLEMAKFFAKPENKPKNSIMFVAFSGHHNSLRGAVVFSKEFWSVYTWQNNREKFDEWLKVRMNINVDFSAGSPILYFVAEGGEMRYFGGDTIWLGVYGNIRVYIDSILSKVRADKPFGKSYPLADFDKNAEYEQYLRSDVSKVADGRVIAWKDFAYDHEPLWANYVPALTITTAYDCRPQYGEPFDTMTWVDSRANAWENVESQFEQSLCIIYTVVNEDDPDLIYKGWPMERREQGMGRYAYFGTISGRVGYYSREKAYYVPVPHALVYLRVAIINFRSSYHYRRYFVFADEYGKFGILPIVSRYWALKEISAWVIDNRTGEILMAPDMGLHKYMSRTLPGDLPAYPVADFGWFTIFNASSLVFFDTIAPTTLTLYKPEVGGFRMPTMYLYRHDTKVQPEMYSGLSCEWAYGGYPQVTILFVPPGLRMETTWLFPPSRYPYAILNNATETYPMGKGYKLRHGEQLIIPFTALKYAECIYLANKERFRIVAQFEPGVYDSPSYQRQSHAEELINEAYQAIKNREYRKAYVASLEAWHSVFKAYFEVRPKIEDAVSVVPIIAALLLPFVFLAEKLLFAAHGVKRLFSFVGIFAFILFAFYFIHPGFQLAASPIMIVIGFSTLILCFPIMVIIFSYVSSYMTELRRERLGRHEVEVSRISEIDHAFLTGVENMRRMKLRTILTLLTIIIMVSSVVSIASISALRVTRVSPSAGGVANYQGVFIRRFEWGQGSYNLGLETLQLLQEWYGDKAIIAPRVWRYSAYYSSLEAFPQRVGFRIYNGEKHVSAMVLWGLSPAEKDLLKIEDLMRGGRWFESTDKKAIIINEVQARTLGINETDVDKGPVPVIFEGMKWYVIGIVDRVIVERLMEMDGEGVTPLKFDLDYNPYTEHVTMDYCFIIPWREALQLGGGIASISLMFNNATEVEEAAAQISAMLSTYLTYFTRPDPETGELKCYMSSEMTAYTLMGFEFQAVPLTIVVLAIFNIVMGSVYERRREISTYSVVGLSPLHIAMMFLAESIVYALLGGVIGYLVAMTMAKLIGIVIPVGVLALNYSSSWVTMALGLSMAATIIASIYPAWVASRLVTPSLERAWKIPTKPKGDLWEIPLPFYAVGEEYRGILNYIREYMEAHAAPQVPDFSVTNLQVKEGKMEDKNYISLEANIKLAPYETGVAERTQFFLVEVEPNRWETRILAQRTMGPTDRWARMHRHYVDLFRKQLLLWRSLPPAERQKYVERSKRGTFS